MQDNKPDSAANKKPDWVNRVCPKMKLNGKPALKLNTEQIIEALKAMPSGLAERNLCVTHIKYKKSREEDIANKIVVSERWPERSEAMQNFALEIYKTAADEHEARGDMIAAAHCCYKSGNAYRTRKFAYDSEGRLNSELAVLQFETALRKLSIPQNNDRFFLIHRTLYDAVCVTINFLRQNGHEQKADYYYARLEKLRETAAECFVNQQGPLDKTAYRIEQGEVGYSNSEKIGTDNVNQCVTLMLHDPKSKLTGLAHIDFHTDTKSLDEMFERMPHRKLQARILGARYINQDVSNNNLARVTNYLKGKDVDLLSADVCDSHGPMAVVVNPADFSIQEAVPYAFGSNRKLSNAIYYFLGEGKKLRTSLDLTKSNESRPLLLPQKAIEKLRSLIPYCYDDVELFSELDKRGIGQKVLSSYNILALLDEYLAQMAILQKTLDQKLRSLYKAGLLADDNVIAQAQKLIEKTPMYVGVKAVKANSHLVEYISNNLFTVSDGKVEISNAVQGDIYKASTLAYNSKRFEAYRKLPVIPAPIILPSEQRQDNEKHL